MFRRFRYLTSAISVTTRLVSRFAQLKLPTNTKKTASLLLTTTNVFTGQACVNACPYGARKKDPEMKNPPEKCNFCIHRLEAGLLPSCVETCIGHARLIGDINDPKSEVYKILKTEKAYRLLASAGTCPNIYYIGLPEIDDKHMLETPAPRWQH